MFVSGITTIIISNEEMNDIMKIVKSLEESGLLIKGVSETITNEVKEQKSTFLSMLLGKLGASLLQNLLTDKRTIEQVKVQLKLFKMFKATLSFNKFLKYKSIIKMNLNLMVFIWS